MIERSYVPADLPAVMQIYTNSIRLLAAPFYSPEQIAAWAPKEPDAGRWTERLSQLHTIVAESEGKLAGFVSYTDEGYLDFLFTHPASARQGVARRLYQQVELAMQSAGVNQVTTHASLAARPFFENQGFEVQAEESVECRGAFLRRFVMAKRIGDA